MKWKSHREVTKAIAEDLRLPIEPMLRGSVYPDRVGKKKSGKSVYIERVAMHYPHHKETDWRIRMMNTRKFAYSLAVVMLSYDVLTILIASKLYGRFADLNPLCNFLGQKNPIFV